MPSLLDELVKLLALEKLEENLFRGQSQDLGWGTVFGGQVLGQALSALTPGMQVASLDHVMWFHQPFRADQWLLHVIDSPVARAGRGLVHGSIYSQDGRLVASTAQEGLIRQKPPPSGRTDEKV